MTKEPSAGERIADLVGGGKFETVTGLAHAIDAAIRDSNAELREALEYYADEIRYGRVHMAADSYGEYLASDVMFDQGKIAKEALARHSADKGEV